MKNIHLIPTDKPNRLHEYGDIWFKYKEPTECFKNYNIYITSNEEIKNGDYVLSDISVGALYLDGKINTAAMLAEGQWKKVVITTNQDLDDVQAIDDEFLEWFMKNPNCEEVEVTYDVLKPFKSENKGYLIHCPDNEVLEEPKQETTLKELLLQLRNTPMTFVPKEEQKQHLIDMMRYDEELGLYEEPKQETLEEAAEKFAINIQTKAGTMSRENAIEWFKAGFRYQAKIMYSDEEVFNLCRAFATFVAHKDPSYKKQQEWFEQIKKR